ncbi:hypothetical protein LS71_003320 [Helicobacter jaachi]|uniref:Uncharacterized protein n=1 Tax=Helicobacter jaachi TaxID=1677920 RepID=A0A4U8TCU0_9HELI|nr:hypothetical protein [Helicobacter jaachi]TLD97775.1 hypothetical protein LS71_003320 [Helicobacter jaachi]
MDIKQILQAHNIHTRIVPAELQVSFSMLTAANEPVFKKEYVSLSQHRYGSITQWLNKNKSKNRTEDTDEVLLELLVELYQKVENIEQILYNRAKQYVPLEHECIADSIGHSVICVPSTAFTEGQKYYLRVFLPVFPQRYIGIFARAIDAQIVVFEHIHQSDMEDFDSFVAQMERSMILDSKSLPKE